MVQLQNSSALKLSKTSNCIIYLPAYSAEECFSMGFECNDEVSDVIRRGSDPVLTIPQLSRYLSRWPPKPFVVRFSYLGFSQQIRRTPLNRVSSSQGSVPIELPTDRFKLFITKEHPQS